MVTDQHATIGQRVKKQRKDRGLSQTDLADGICSSSTVSLLETDQHVPSAEILQKIAEKLAVPLQEIVSGSEGDLDIAMQLNIIEILVEAGDFVEALPMIHELENREEVVEYQRRSLVLLSSECLMRTGEAEQAIEQLTTLQQQLEQQREPNNRLMATMYNKLGSAYYFASNMVFAHANYLRAYQITLSLPVDLLSASISFNLANMCRWLGLYEESIFHYKYAYEFFGKISDRIKLARTLMDIGITFRKLGEFEEAKDCLQQSRAIFKAENMLDLARRARQQYAFYILGKQEPMTAVDELLDCSEEYRLVGDFVRQAYSYAKIASLYLDQNQPENAEQYIKMAIFLFSEEMLEQDPKLPYVYRVYATFLLKMNQYEQAIKYAYQSSEAFCKMGLERNSADSLQVVVSAYRRQESTDQLIETLDRVNETLLRACKKPYINWMEEF